MNLIRPSWAFGSAKMAAEALGKVWNSFRGLKPQNKIKTLGEKQKEIPDFGLEKYITY